MKKKYKYHAIYFVDKQCIKFVDNWDTAKELMQGHPHLNKGYNTREELIDWINGITVNDIARARHDWRKNK